MTTTQQAYQALFEDFKSRAPAGSSVKLVRYWTDEEARLWGTDFCTDTMQEDFAIGAVLEIESYSHKNAFCNGWNFPITCLDVVSTKPQCVEVKLNGDYTAYVHKDKIVVGCQEFPSTILSRLNKAHEDVSS